MSGASFQAGYRHSVLFDRMAANRDPGALDLQRIEVRTRHANGTSESGAHLTETGTTVTVHQSRTKYATYDDDVTVVLR
jgi:hypothetical protein